MWLGSASLRRNLCVGLKTYGSSGGMSQSPTASTFYTIGPALWIFLTAQLMEQQEHELRVQVMFITFGYSILSAREGIYIMFREQIKPLGGQIAENGRTRLANQVATSCFDFVS